MRRAARRDEAEPPIVDALEAVGASVQRLAVKGVPDLLVGWRGRMWLLEVKLPLTARGALPRGRSLKHKGGHDDMTADQVAWWAAWRGPAPVIVRTVDEALAAIGALPSDETTIAKVMQTTGATRAEAEFALVDGKRLADWIRKAAELPADLVPDAIAVHLQRKTRC